MNEERWMPLWRRSHNTDRSGISEAQAAAGAISAQAVSVGVLAPFFCHLTRLCSRQTPSASRVNLRQTIQEKGANNLLELASHMGVSAEGG